MIALLRRLNSLPFEVTVRHYYPLPGQRGADLTEAKGWDVVRTTESNFLIPDDRRTWLRMCESRITHDSIAGDLPSRAYDILDLLEKYGVQEQLFSFGVGLAALEYHIKRLQPSLHVYCSDYGIETVSRLKKIFHECDGIVHFDLIRERFSQVFPQAKAGAMVLINRVDPHLSDVQWEDTFDRLAADKVQRILFVPHRLLTLRYLLDSKCDEAWHRVRGNSLALSGMVRTKRRWLRLWANRYELLDEPPIGYSSGFLLKLRNNSHS
ncbi:MAG: hypothetical protein JW395_3177 [Nitrospira sp.]|nr:hypothetical protein [Nitrospira sp.]